METLKAIFEVLENKGITTSEYKEEGVLCGYELSTCSNGGVNNIMLLDFRDHKNNGNPNDAEDFINEFESYLNDFDIDLEIEMLRQGDKSYREAFTLKQAVKDFKSWLKEMKKIVKAIKKGLK